MTINPQVYQLKVTLQDIRSPVWRRLLIPSNVTFWKLHIAIQDSFGWEDYHLHEFFVGPAWDRNVTHIAIPNPEDDWGEGEEALDESKIRLDEFLSEDQPKLTYVYDFGDNWEHKIALEKVLPFNPEEVYPQIIAGKRACPWEDSGGIGGYEYKIEVLKDKKQPEHREIADWVGVGDFNDLDLESFDPRDVIFRNPATELQRFRKAMSV
ncbi:plasmid pRiA4b ORF-3 family protein [Candidatus Woesebacteria bacterium]|nr:plasmid pRiA4b ORF-3 family protein [Candidatus Woesebacteria bacterium]